MRRLSILLAAIALTGLSAGVVGGPEAGEGEMVIMDAGSSSATQSVGPNGTKWRTQISNLESACLSGNQTQHVDFGNFTGAQGEDNLTKITFSGVINTSNPCHEINLDVTEVSEDTYIVEFVENSTGGVCVQCIGYVKFDGSFAAPGEYKVIFENEDNDLATKTTPGYGESDKPEQSRSSVLERFFSWLGSLF
ncbi:MAG: hypothetical protein ABEJ36_01275 [Candidatus Nanosalina sp.]